MYCAEEWDVYRMARHNAPALGLQVNQITDIQIVAVIDKLHRNSQGKHDEVKIQTHGHSVLDKVGLHPVPWNDPKSNGKYSIVDVIFRERLDNTCVYLAATLPWWEKCFVSFGRWKTTFESRGDEAGVAVHVVPNSEDRDTPVSNSKKF
jgi:transposase